MSTGAGFAGYAKGAIKTHAELMDLIIEARIGKKAIRLYAVEQGGYFAELFVTSRSKVEASERCDYIFGFDAWARHSGRFYKSHRCLGDLNIADKNGRRGGHNRHQLFANRRHAQEYAASLQGDKAYQQAVAEHHRRMTVMFRALGDY